MKKNTLFLGRLSIITLLFMSLLSCSGQAGPKPIKYGKDQCVYCKMTISDARFGTQLVTKKGRAYNFDDVQCMIAFVKESQVEKAEVATFYLPDYNSQKLMVAEKMFYLKSEGLKSPMRGDIAAFVDKAALEKTQKELGGTQMTWDELWK